MNAYQKYTKHRLTIVKPFFSLSVEDVTSFEDGNVSLQLLNLYLE